MTLSDRLHLLAATVRDEATAFCGDVHRSSQVAQLMEAAALIDVVARKFYDPTESAPRRCPFVEPDGSRPLEHSCCRGVPEATELRALLAEALLDDALDKIHDQDTALDLAREAKETAERHHEMWRSKHETLSATHDRTLERLAAAERSLEGARRAAYEAAALAITPTTKNSDGVTAGDFYPYLGESSWDLLKRAQERIRALSMPEPGPTT